MKQIRKEIKKKKEKEKKIEQSAKERKNLSLNFFSNLWHKKK